MSWYDELWQIITNEIARNVGDRFTLHDLYEFADMQKDRHPQNRHIFETMRDKVQELRDDGLIEFVDEEGTYRRLA